MDVKDRARFLPIPTNTTYQLFIHFFAHFFAPLAAGNAPLRASLLSSFAGILNFIAFLLARSLPEEIESSRYGWHSGRPTELADEAELETSV
ncbi:hypothetical protein EYF80_010851 [Liparis tanakae]|uniref:Uncharacterized protein n=1 Tax=Liparis tanakae TaxID=230148 RepID=A0A4Z2IM46_9TELE|nr:hypothetical protein EYF80_010851 [Liparis tanakae]